MHPRLLLIGLILLAPAFMQQARAQNGPPQTMSQSSATQATQAALPQTEGESAAWRGTLARVAESVVAIEIDQTRAFDTEWNSSAQARVWSISDRKSTRLNSSHVEISYAVFCLKKKKVQASQS